MARAAESSAAASGAPATRWTGGAAVRRDGGDRSATSGPASGQSCTDRSARSSAAVTRTTRTRKYSTQLVRNDVAEITSHNLYLQYSTVGKGLSKRLLYTGSTAEIVKFGYGEFSPGLLPAFHP